MRFMAQCGNSIKSQSNVLSTSTSTSLHIQGFKVVGGRFPPCGLFLDYDSLLHFAGVDIIVPLKDVHAIEGTKAILESKISVPDVSSSKWYLNDQQVKPDDRVQAISKGTKQRLVFNRTFASDEGHCKLVVGKVETGCNLTIERKFPSCLRA